MAAVLSMLLTVWATTKTTSRAKCILRFILGKRKSMCVICRFNELTRNWLCCCADAREREEMFWLHSTTLVGIALNYYHRRVHTLTHRQLP